MVGQPQQEVPRGRRFLVKARENKRSINSGMKPEVKRKVGGAWVAQSAECLTSAQVMISQFMGSSPASGSVLTAQSLESASDSVSPPLSAPPPLALCLPLSQK